MLNLPPHRFFWMLGIAALTGLWGCGNPDSERIVPSSRERIDRSLSAAAAFLVGQQGQDACRTAQRRTGQDQAHEQHLHAGAVGVPVTGIILRVQQRRQVHLFFPPRPAA